MDFHLSIEKEEEIRERTRSKCILSTTIGRYEVTTCYRQSSACVEPPPWYYETFVWLWGDDRRALVGDATGIGHIRAVQRILDLGEWKDIEED